MHFSTVLVHRSALKHLRVAERPPQSDRFHAPSCPDGLTELLALLRAIKFLVAGSSKRLLISHVTEQPCCPPSFVEVPAMSSRKFRCQPRVRFYPYASEYDNFIFRNTGNLQSSENTYISSHRTYSSDRSQIMSIVYLPMAFCIDGLRLVLSTTKCPNHRSVISHPVARPATAIHTLFRSSPAYENDVDIPSSASVH